MHTTKSPRFDPIRSEYGMLRIAETDTRCRSAQERSASDCHLGGGGGG
jgi:hypothetical protein